MVEMTQAEARLLEHQRMLASHIAALDQSTVGSPLASHLDDPLQAEVSSDCAALQRSSAEMAVVLEASTQPVDVESCVQGVSPLHAQFACPSRL
jgi:hypothetical protein